MAKVGDTIMILGFADQENEPAANQYLYKRGVVTYIDGMKCLHGTWGGIGILPEDKYEIVKRA